MKIDDIEDAYPAFQAIQSLDQRIGAVGQALGLVITVAGSQIALDDDTSVRAAIKADLIAQRSQIVADLVKKGWEAS